MSQTLSEQAYWLAKALQIMFPGMSDAEALLVAHDRLSVRVARREAR